MKFGWLSLALCAGVLIPVQAAMNAKLREFVLSPFYSALISFAVGTMVLILLVTLATVQGQPGSWRAGATAPWWAWIGGSLGVVLILAGVVILPRVGAGPFSAALIAGQLCGALILDHFGFLGLAPRAFSASRLIGLTLVLLGVWFIQRK
jgi:bacterial/archaeal transporter family-2 protein